MTHKIIHTFIASIAATIAVSAINLVLLQIGAITYHPQVFKDVYWVGLSVELIVINFLLLLGGISAYNLLNHRFGDHILEKYTFTISNLFLGIAVAFAFLGHKRLYTLLVFLLLFALLFCIEYWNKTRFMYKFYRSFLVLLLPLGLINWQLIREQILVLPANTRLPQDFGLIPIENYFYSMAVFLFGVLIFEKLQSRASS